MSSLKERALKALNLKDFNDYNLPLSIGNCILSPPPDKQYILRMIIRHGHGDYKIPKEFEWVIPLIEMSERHQNELGIRHLCCYLTIRNGLVESVTDDVWHTDGFSTSITHLPEQNYIIANCYPTEFAVKPIAFPEDFNPRCHNIHKYIQQRISTRDTFIGKANTVFCIDPYVIHRRQQIPDEVVRSFIRVSYTPIEIMDDNNTPNPLIQMPIYNRDGVAIRNLLSEYKASENR